jgi:hypothetical protein
MRLMPVDLTEGLGMAADADVVRFTDGSWVGCNEQRLSAASRPRRPPATVGIPDGDAARASSDFELGDEANMEFGRGSWPCAPAMRDRLSPLGCVVVWFGVCGRLKGDIVLIW